MHSVCDPKLIYLMKHKIGIKPTCVSSILIIRPEGLLDCNRNNPKNRICRDAHLDIFIRKIVADIFMAKDLHNIKNEKKIIMFVEKCERPGWNKTLATLI